MATTTKILATANRYGSTGGSVANSYAYNGRAYAGKYEDGRVYRSRLTFPGIRTLAAIGDANIVITKVTLTLHRHSGGPCVVTAGASADSAWGAATDGSGSLNIAAQTAWYTIDITECAQAILNYAGNWYIHLTGNGTRICFNGIEEGATPYINVVWEYSANTLTTDADSVEIGTEAHFSIAPEEGDASFALTYEFGDEAGTIAETSNTSIAWTPPLSFAAELPEADSGEVKVTMKVYDADGAQKRTEVLYLTVTVPETAVLKVDDGAGMVNGFSGYALTGKTYLNINPGIDINDAYGATFKTIKAELVNGNSTQLFTWDTASEVDAGKFKCSPQTSGILLNAGEAVVTVTVTDSRGREVTAARTFEVKPYANPLITAFSVERYEAVYSADEQIIGYAPSDTGENVWVTIKASCTDIEGLNKLSWGIRAKDANGETEYSGGGDSIAIDIVNDRGIITAVVPAAMAVEYTLIVHDLAGNTAFGYDNVTPGRANFALAASKYGASFGCLPKGTEENPMLESAYPFYAYAPILPFGGIEGVTNYVAEETKTGGTWIDGKPIYRKIISLNVPKVTTWYSSSGDNTITDFDTCVRMDVVHTLSKDGTIVVGATFYDSSRYIRIHFSVVNGVFKISASCIGDLYLGTTRATVYYTKTTD